MALSKRAPASGFFVMYSKNRIPCTCWNEDLPVCTLWRICPHAFHHQFSPVMIATAHTEFGASVRRHSAIGVNAKRPVWSSAKTPMLASARISR
jgi:hypothetical protein